MHLGSPPAYPRPHCTSAAWSAGRKQTPHSALWHSAMGHLPALAPGPARGPPQQEVRSAPARGPACPHRRNQEQEHQEQEHQEWSNRSALLRQGDQLALKTGGTPPPSATSPRPPAGASTRTTASGASAGGSDTRPDALKTGSSRSRNTRSIATGFPAPSRGPARPQNRRQTPSLGTPQGFPTPGTFQEQELPGAGASRQDQASLPLPARGRPGAAPGPIQPPLHH